MAADMENQKKEVEVENVSTTETQKSGDSETSKDVPPVEKLIKHPLENTWTLWFFKQDSSKSWEESQMAVASFHTVEDFWALYNHIELASKLKVGCDYSVFKKGIKPMWEDDQNKKGGRWLINLNRQQRSLELDTFWLEMLMMMIGEAFSEHSDEVCGAVVNIRSKADKVGVWTRDALNAAGNCLIGQIMKKRLNIPNNVQLGYQSHTDSMVKTSSVNKNRYVV